MRAGTLRDLIRFERETTVEVDDRPVRAWEGVAGMPVRPIPAEIRHLSGDDTIKAGQDASIVKATIVVRVGLPVDSSMRALDVVSGRAYAVRAVLPSTDRQHVELVCEVVNG